MAFDAQTHPVDAWTTHARADAALKAAGGDPQKALAIRLAGGV